MTRDPNQPEGDSAADSPSDDPLLDSMLEELLDDVRPPDLAEQILRRHASRPLPTLKETTMLQVNSRSARGRRRSSARWTQAFAIVCVVVMIAVGGVFIGQRLMGPDQPNDGRPLATRPKQPNRSQQPNRTEKPSSTAQAHDLAVDNPSQNKPDDDSPPEKNPTPGSGTSPANDDPKPSAFVDSDDVPAPIVPEVVRPTDTDADQIAGPSSVRDDEVISGINASIRRGWDDADVKPSAGATDAEWCRRLFMAVVGRIPTVNELERFLADPSKAKRTLLVDRLLESSEYTEQYAQNWASIWTTLLIGRADTSQSNDPTNREGMRQYLRRAFLKNRPYDQIVGELVSATGSTQPGDEDFNGAANFLAAKLDAHATRATARTAQLFLGVQIQCTQCHNHPFNDWRQQHYWQLNAFFRQSHTLRADSGSDGVARLVDHDFLGEGKNPDAEEAEIYYQQRNGLTKVAYPVFIDGRVIDANGLVDQVNRRRELARLITSSPWLARAATNRMWQHFFGHGFTSPVDDMGPHNRPTHPELLQRISEQFASKRYDIKSLIRWIVLSDPYALSSRANAKNRDDDPAAGRRPLFSRYYIRQMRPEQLFDSLLAVADPIEHGDAQREQIKSDWMRQFTIAYGTDEGGEAMLLNGSTLQSLAMMNGKLVGRATDSQGDGFLGKVVRSDVSNSRKINQLFLASVARRPTRKERGMANRLLTARGGNASEALEDMWWALLNSNEFILDH